MLPSFTWLIVAFVAGVLCCALLLWTLRRFGPKTWLSGRRAKPLDVKDKNGLDKKGLPLDTVNDVMREISGSAGQMANMVGKACSLLQEEKDDREALLRLFERRSQEILQLLGQAVYHLETQAELSRDLRPTLGVGAGTNPIPKQRATETAVTAGGMQPARNPATVIEESRLRAPGNLTELIGVNFARIDLETSRRFEEFRKSFLEILGTRVVDIREEDGAVLFLETKTMGLLWPWPNNTIQKRWRECFHAPKGENAPVRAVEQPAVVSCQADQWTLRTKGAVRQ